MTTPKDVPLKQDDSLDQNDEQMSQRDIHSYGFDETNEDIGEVDETDKLDQAYDAAQPSFTLDLEDDDDPEDDE